MDEFGSMIKSAFSIIIWSSLREYSYPILNDDMAHMYVRSGRKGHGFITSLVDEMFWRLPASNISFTDDAISKIEFMKLTYAENYKLCFSFLMAYFVVMTSWDNFLDTEEKNIYLQCRFTWIFHYCECIVNDRKINET